MVLAEKGISLTENAVERRGYDTNTETARSFRDNLVFCLFICDILNEILYIESKSGKIIIQKYFANTY